MDDFITIFVFSALGEGFAQKLAEKKINILLLFVLSTFTIYLIIIIFIFFLSLPGLFNGYYENKIALFFFDFAKAVLIDTQPYLILFSMALAFLLTLGYLWHRKYSHKQMDDKLQ